MVVSQRGVRAVPGEPGLVAQAPDDLAERRAVEGDTARRGHDQVHVALQNQWLNTG